jgi:DNA-binding beta-propeller fold protein YncE
MKISAARKNAAGIAVMAILCIIPIPGQTKPPLLWEFSTFGEGGYFYQPSDLCADPNMSRIYIVDKGLHSVLVFDYQGNYLQSIGREGQGPGEFSGPTGIYVLNDSRLAIADNQNNRIQIFDATGQLLSSINPKEVQVAGMVYYQREFFTVSSYGLSGYQIQYDSEKNSLPLISVLDENGTRIRDISSGEKVQNIF